MSNTDLGVENIVLVHGAWVDGSGWEGTYAILTTAGYNVTVVQHPSRDLDEDVDYVRRALDRIDGPVVLVGHSYGGVIISAIGNDPRVKALVYITAFAPTPGQSVNDIISDLPEGVPVPPIGPPEDGFLYVDRELYPSAFAADLDPTHARFLAQAMPGWGLPAASAQLADPAWQHRPSYYLIARDDQMLGEALQRRMATNAAMTIEESPGSHSVFASHPDAVARLAARAAREVQV